MLPFLLVSHIAQTTPPPPQPEEIVFPQEVRPLPGRLDNVPVFNSNSPEKVVNEGILLSTFPGRGKKTPSAHLNFPFAGRFDVFAHHVFEAPSPDNLRSLYKGIILYNPGTKPVTVSILHGASYLSQPDAPFIELPSLLQNLENNVYAGPGSRVMSDILRGLRQNLFPNQIIIPPKQYQMLLNEPIPVQELTPPLNGRSTYARLRSNAAVYIASLATPARTNADGTERAPTIEEWRNILDNGELSTPRDIPPTPLEQTSPRKYGRVAGVARGSYWRAQLTDNSKTRYLTIPQPGQGFSYGLSTLQGGTLGTNQVQSAPMLVRYPDTAYLAHGNYGVQYNLRLPLYNQTKNVQTVSLSVQTPIKEEQLSKKGLRFFATLARPTFFRGTVRVSYRDDLGQIQTNYLHLVQRRGQQGESLVELPIRPGQRRLVEVDFLYPPDATPPQVLTVKTLDNTVSNR
ncbi:MAG: DUF3370 domain-containing protein [Calothrix sp. C42_A2020_038]|nr:DUF3370 domain-containing protein [Calothrix sp. C42_A2020_038]